MLNGASVKTTGSQRRSAGDVPSPTESPSAAQQRAEDARRDKARNRSNRRWSAQAREQARPLRPDRRCARVTAGQRPMTGDPGFKANGSPTARRLPAPGDNDRVPHTVDHHRSGRRADRRLPGADRRRAADPLGATARPVHRRGRAGAAPGAASRLPGCARSWSTPSGWTRSARSTWADTPVYAAGQDVLEAVTGFHVHRGILASFRRQELPTVAEVLAASTRLVVLEDINNHTNLGAIYRGAAALGFDGVLLSPSCADPLYRRSVRVSMGEVFAIPYARLDPWPTGLDVVRAAGFTLIAMTPASDSVPLNDLDATARQPAGAALRRGGLGPDAAGDGRRRRPGGDPDAPRRGLAERGGVGRGRVLGAVPMSSVFPERAGGAGARSGALRRARAWSPAPSRWTGRCAGCTSPRCRTSPPCCAAASWC